MRFNPVVLHFFAAVVLSLIALNLIITAVIHLRDRILKRGRR